MEVFYQLGQLEGLSFYDDVNKDIGEFLYDKFAILKTETEVKEYFIKYGNRFTIGVGNPHLRYKLYNKFRNLGGDFTSIVSPLAEIGHFGNNIGEGSNIMTGTIITNDIFIGKGSLINLSCTIGHDSIIHEFVELCPDVNISGNCTIGAYTFVGTNSVVLPNVKIGKNVVIGAGSIVTKDIPDNCMALGIPAKIIKELTPLSF
ncbi:hexapeptide transferase [Flavobacterium sp. LM5]|uniref:acetyltransferase n=1 Tax=Flavobacterium sp. LM5 TaxID=1938610 RepID=UPI000991A81A|nr:acetyltransferase [Flavobacterium sp. LM5]OOV29267.1 hexapeptide transferase [Flavobacterium sp. LM5]